MNGDFVAEVSSGGIQVHPNAIVVSVHAVNELKERYQHDLGPWWRVAFRTSQGPGGIGYDDYRGYLYSVIMKRRPSEKIINYLVGRNLGFARQALLRLYS